jgi:hypothetical protein
LVISNVSRTTGEKTTSPPVTISNKYEFIDADGTHALFV